MSENITIPLKPDSAVEPFAERERNLLQVQVGIGGVWHCSPDCIVSISLSREAMIGLATALLRAAHAPPEKSMLTELLPSELGFASLAAGVYMHPQSCRLNLLESDLGDLAHVLHEKA
jgi:hypothetical protein